jgi:hypothetical protein
MKGKIFNAQEVQAIIAGNKTMFREIAKIKLSIASYNFDTKQFYDDPIFKKCPYQVGQKIFVKEEIAHGGYFGACFVYCADGTKSNKMWQTHWSRHFRPANYMNEKQSRLTLEITDVKVERLKDISEEDAIKEGVNKLFTEEEMKHVLRVHQIEKNDTYKNYLWHGHIGRTITKKQSDEWEYQCSAYEKAKDSFFSLWNATHKKSEEKFEANPFVWVVDFKINK